MAWCPVWSTATDLEQEVVEDLSAPGRMGHLRVELHAKEWPPVVLERGNRGIHARCRDRIAGRESIDVIAVAHPDRGLFSQAEPVEQATPFDSQVGPAVLAPIGARHLPTGEVGQELHPVAEAEDRSSQLEQSGISGGDARSEEHTSELQSPD